MTTTTTESGFLTTIITNPNDDDLRLIYADFLEENGQEAHAEFIRVQCKLANREYTRMSGDEATSWHLETRDLRCRERELLQQHGCSWIPEVPGLARFGHVSNPLQIGWFIKYRGKNSIPLPVTFRRGFVAEITCTLADWMGEACLACWRGDRMRTSEATFFQLFLGEDNHCPTCHGTSRIGGYGLLLVRAAPIERVRIIDKGVACPDALLPYLPRISAISEDELSNALLKWAWSQGD